MLQVAARVELFVDRANRHRRSTSLNARNRILPTVLGGLLGAGDLGEGLYGMDLSADLFVTPNEAPTRRTGVFLAAQGNGPHKQGDPREGGMGESANKATIAYRDDQYKVVMNSAYCTVGDTKYANASCDCESTWLGESYLFDIVNDPTESVNLILDLPDVVDDYRATLAEEYNKLVGYEHTGFPTMPYLALAEANANIGARQDGDPIYLVPYLDEPIHVKPLIQNDATPGEFLWVSDDPASETDADFNDLMNRNLYGSNWRAVLAAL